ncbi:MAG: transposase [Leeuwenhoekiella sp.]|nr:MAG: transposase [Leeuwenhoekiella sp.]
MQYEPISAGNYYHIYNRGNNYEDIFIEDRNYEYFLNLIGKHLTSVLEVLSYCLLKNHFHMIVRTFDNTEDHLISRKFSNLFNAYAKSINKAYGRNGSLFKDRFSRKKIDQENYLRNLIIYVHLNPTKHFGIDFKTYKYSSYQAFISNKRTLLNRDFVLGLFDDEPNFKAAHCLTTFDPNNEYLLE